MGPQEVEGAHHVPTNVLAGALWQQFLNDMMLHCEIAWGNYHIPAGQRDDILAPVLAPYMCEVHCGARP